MVAVVVGVGAVVVVAVVGVVVAVVVAPGVDDVVVDDDIGSSSEGATEITEMGGARWVEG